jgi:hypothetical protein
VSDQERHERRQAALAILGHLVRFNHEPDTAIPRLCCRMSGDGMVEVLGMTGLFAPHLFKRADDWQTPKGGQ